MHDREPEPSPTPSSKPAYKPSARLFMSRALRLRCPECGVSPMFVPARRVRSIWDWFTPLDGCPRCGYAYERESGYFLLATWAFNYGVVAGLGIVFALVIDHYFQPSLWKLIACVAVPMPVMSFLFARHAKALYLAMDHYYDPHRPDGPAETSRTKEGD